ncbi:hypothetical protein Anas_08617, partial [Armadillidium nasatum]
VIFCRSGYEKASKNFDEEDLKVDCTGYHFMITGANSGIGKCVTTSIAERGGTIHMVCRNETAGNETKLAIMKTTEMRIFMFMFLIFHKAWKWLNFVKNLEEPMIP